MVEAIRQGNGMHWTQTPAYKRIAIFVALMFLLIGIVRGINFPNLWTYTHYLLPCTDFFVKRTAIGCIVETIGIIDFFQYEFFVYYSFLILFSFWLGLTLKTITTINKGEFTTLSGVLVFCIGLAPIYLSNISGYFDFLGALLVLLSISITSFRLKLLVTTLGFIFLVFVHEAILVIFLPLAVVDLCMIAHETDEKLRGKRLWFVGGMGVSLLSLALLVANSSIDTGTAKDLLGLAQEKTSIPLSSGVFDIFSRDISDNRGLMLWFIEQVLPENGGLKSIVLYIMRFLLGALIITHLNFIMARYIYGSKLIAAVVSLAPLSALLLLFVAYDIIRWAAWATACSFCLYMILCAKGGAVALRGLRISLVLIVLFSLSQMAVEIPLLTPRENRPVVSSTASYIHAILTGTGSISPSRPLY